MLLLIFCVRMGEIASGGSDPLVLHVGEKTHASNFGKPSVHGSSLLPPVSARQQVLAVGMLSSLVVLVVPRHDTCMTWINGCVHWTPLPLFAACEQLAVRAPCYMLVAAAVAAVVLFISRLTPAPLSTAMRLLLAANCRPQHASTAVGKHQHVVRWCWRWLHCPACAGICWHCIFWHWQIPLAAGQPFSSTSCTQRPRWAAAACMLMGGVASVCTCLRIDDFPACPKQPLQASAAIATDRWRCHCGVVCDSFCERVSKSACMGERKGEEGVVCACGVVPHGAGWQAGGVHCWLVLVNFPRFQLKADWPHTLAPPG